MIMCCDQLSPWPSQHSAVANGDPRLSCFPIYLYLSIPWFEVGVFQKVYTKSSGIKGNIDFGAK